MASGGETCAPAEDEGGVPLDIDDVHLLLQVEQEQIQKRTFTNWINAQFSKRSHPTVVQDLFSDLRDGTRLLDLLEVMSGQRMKRERGHGVFQQRGNIETALNFLKNKSIKLVNINIPDIIEGKPSIILGLIWTIILHCHIEELASTLSYGSRSSSLDSLSSLDSVPGSPRSSPVPRGASPLRTRFRLSAKKALLLWVRDQCQKVGCSASVRDFKSSWRSGEVFLAILCSLRPDLVDLSQVQTSSHRENLERAFHLAEKELRIPRLLEPEDIDVSNPDEKSIMTYIAQFLQYSNDLPVADDDFEASPTQKAREIKCWLERAYQELLEAWNSTEGNGYAERYQAFQNFVGTYYDQRRPVITVLSAMRRCAKPSEEQMALRKAWDTMEERLQEYRTELDVGLPAPLNTLGRWLQHMEAVLSEDSGSTEDNALAARDARQKQEQLKVLVEDLSQHLNTLHHYRNTDDDGCLQVPIEKLEEIKRRFTSARVTAKYHGIKLQYREQMHHVYDLLGRLKSKLSLWRGPYGSQESVHSLQQDWHDTVDKQGLVWLLKEALHKLKDTAVSYTNKAALADDSPVVNRQVKEADSETGVSTEAAEAVRSTMERVVAAWVSYKDCLYLLQVWLGQEGQSEAHGQEDKHFSSNLNEWRSRQAQLNEAGNFLIDMSDASTSHSLTEELRKLNIQWADFIKRTKFAVAPQPITAVPGVQAAQSLMQEASWVLRETVEVSSGPLRIYRKKLQGIIKKMSAFNLNSLSPSPDCKEETLQKLRQTLPETFETLTRVDQVCERLQKATSLLEGRLAELENWSTEAQEVCNHLKERQHRGHRGPHPRAKGLISRGLLLEGQVVTEGEDLQVLVTSVQKNSSLPYLRTSALQDRLQRTVSHCQEVTEMLSSHGVKRGGQPKGAQPASKVFVQAYSQPESQIGTIQHHQKQTFSKSSILSPESPVEPQSQELYSSQLEATSGVQPQVLQQYHDKSPKDQRKAMCQVQHTELKQPLLSSVVGRKVEMKPQTEVQLISVVSSLTSSFGPSDLQAASVNSSQISGFGPLDPLQVISVDPNQTSDFRPSELQVLSSQTSGFRPLDSIQVISVDSGETRDFEPSDLQVISVDSSQTSGIEQSNPLQSLSSTTSSPSTLLTSVTMTQLKMPGEQHLGSPPKWQPQTSLVTPHQRQRVLAKSHSFPQPHDEPSQTLPVTSLASCPSTLHTPVTVTQQTMPIKQPPKWQPQTSLTTLHQRQTVLSKSHSFPQPSEVPGVPHVPVQNEVYARAQALARSRLDKAKKHLHEHIQDVITVISTRDKSKKQANKKQAVSCLLRPAVLETFLEAVKGMGDFCSDAQLRDMDLLCQSVRAQWEVCATAAVRSVHLEALRSITESLQPAESVLLSTTHLRTDTKKVETVQCRTDSTNDLAPCQDGRGGAVKDCVLLRKTVLLDDLSLDHSQAVVQTNIVEIKQIPERTVIHPCSAQEERVTTEETQSSYSAVQSVFQQQLLNNSQQLGSEFPISPGSNASISADSLRIQLQHLLALKDRTEALWREFELQYSQSSQHMEDGCNMEQERTRLIQQWKEQQMCFQARVKSLETAVELLESADNQIRLISDHIKQISQKPLNIRNFAVADPKNLHEEIKRLDESIEKELFLLKSDGSVSDASHLSPIELQAHLPLQQTLHGHTICLDQQRQCLRKSESALVGLVNLLSHLQKVNAEFNAAHNASNHSLVSIRQSLQQARDESVQLDQLLDDAGMRITLDDKPGSCHEMVSALALRVEEVEARLAVGLKQSDRGGKGRVEGEQRDRAFGRKRMGLQVALREVLTALEKHGLKEPTLPALQHRLRFLTDMESKLVALRSEIQDLRNTCAQTSTSDTGISELQTQWENAHRAVTESREQCVSLTEFLKKFQSCRNRLGSTLQKAEQTIGDQASYMGKDNLQLLISKVTSLKSDLSGLGDGVEEFRAVCRQLQSLMRRIPDCADTPFESEADSLMDLWLDVTEKTDCHLDNLQAGLSLWEKLLLLAGEVEGWSAQKLMTLAQSNPFQTEKDVSVMEDELRIQEENIEHFHRRSSEIQELLQSREFPLELQVIESQLRKKMAEVKELFSEASDVFRQLGAAKGKMASDIADHLSSIQTITNALTSLTTSESPQVLNTIQGLSEKLQAEAEQVDALLQQINLLASIAGLENLQALAEDGAQIQESICVARELVIEKREQAMNPNRPENPQMVRDPKHIKPRIKKTEDTAPEIQCESNGKTEEQSHGGQTQDPLLELKDFKEQACSWASELYLKGDFQVSEDENRQITLEEKLTAVQDVCVGLGESMNEELTCAMLIQQSHESLDSLQGRIEGSSHDLNALKAPEQVEGNLLEVEKLSEVLQTSCTPEGQTALSQDVWTLFGKTPALRKILEDERTQEGNSDPVQSSIQCIKPQQPGVSTEELQSVQVAADSEVDDEDRMPTKEVSKTEDISPCSEQQATEDVENLPSGHDTNKQQSMSGSKERDETGSVLREDDSKFTHGSSCESLKPVFTIVLDSDLTKSNQIPLTQPVPASSTKWDTVSVVHDGTAETSEDGLKLLEVKPNVDVAVDEEPAVISSSDEPVHLYADISTSEVQFKENSHTDTIEPTHSALDLDFRPKPEKDSSTQAFDPMLFYPEKYQASSGTAKKVFTIILDVDTPTLSSDGYQSLQETQCTGPDDSTTDEFFHSDVKNQQKNSFGTEKHEGRTAELGLSEKFNVKSNSSEMQPGQKEAPLIQPQTPEIIEIDVQKDEKEKQHEVTDAEASSQMDVHTGEGSESGSVVHQQDVPMLESHDEDDNNTSEEPSYEANTLQKPPKVAKGRKKKRKPVGAEKANSISNKKLNTCKSEHKNTTHSESLQTSEVRLPNATDTACVSTKTVSSDFSQPNTAKPLSTENKLTVDTVQKETLNQTEDGHFENISISLAGDAHINTTDMVLAAVQSVQSTHTEDSELAPEDYSSDCITQFSTTVPSELQLSHTEAQRTEDSDGSFHLQYKEMHRANSDSSATNKTSQNRGSGADGEDQTRHAKQPTGTHVWATLLNTITNVQPLLITSHGTEESRPRKDSWLQNSSLLESDSGLAWTVLWVFRCRYRPAQLSIVHMAHQLEEVEICRQYVLEQVSRLPQCESSAGRSTELEMSIEDRWNRVLLDTSTMVEFKKAQLQQVTQYHQQKRVLTDTLHNLEAELNTMTQDCIDSSTLQVEKLNAFLKNMQKKRGILEELLQTCSQISAHLNEAEGPVACIEPFRTLQERWQTIERVASSSLWCANICTAEVSALLQEARDLHHELELLEKSVSLPHPSRGQMDCRSELQETVRSANLTALAELYLYLLEVSQALSSSPLGKKELRDVEDAMQGLNSQLALTRETLSSQTSNGNGCSPITRIIRDYVTWAKHSESKVSRRRRLALFPEEASHQISHMKKLQSETSLKKFQLASVLKELREEVTGLDKEDSMSPTLASLEDLYVKITEKTECAVAEINRMFHIRERLWKQITDSSSWLTSVLEKESGKTVASEPKTTIPELRVQLQVCTEALKEAERQANNLETLLDEVKSVNHGLSVLESFQLINRLTALQEEVSRVVNRKWALRWVLEELLHAQESSAEEQNVILKSLRQMNADVMRQKYPVTRDSLLALEPVQHILMELLCKVPEIPHCPDSRRKEMLNAVLDLQRRMHLLELQAKEHEECLILRQHMENSREVVKKSLSQIVDSSVGADIRLGFCQAVLVELPLVRMTCQEAADHLEAVSKDLYPSQLTAERQKISLVIEQLASWELTVKNEAKTLECFLAERLGSPTDLSPCTELFNSVRQQLKESICLEPDNKTIDAELRKHWMRIQTVESVLRMLEHCRKAVDVESYQTTTGLGQKTLNDCGMHMDKLLQAREALKHYHWAVQGAESFFQQIGSNLMIPSDGFKGYKEQHRYIQQIFSTLVEGFQARLSEVGASVPQQTCLSIPLTEQLHIEVLSHLIVQDAKLESQAQLRLEALQRSMKDQIVHMSHHEEMSQLLKNVDSRISSQCLSQKPTDSEACQDQKLKVKLLQTELKNLAKRLEELRESCPGLRCKAPVDLMLGQLWRSWAVLQWRVESLKASMSHKEAEWRDFVIRMNKSKEGLDRLQNDLPDSTMVAGSLVDLQVVLSLTERLQDGIEQEHHTLASLQHHVARLLGVSNLQQLKLCPQICQDLQSLQGHCRSLRDQSNNIRREVLFEIQELSRVQEELSAIQQNVLSLLAVLQSESAAQHLQEVKVELVSQKARLQDVMDRVQKKWSCVPSEIQILQNELDVSMQEAKDKLGMVMERSGPLRKMGELIGEVTVGLNCVQALLKQTSPNFSEAERTQKRIWDELDQWHTRIAELEAEVQDLAEQKPEREHVLMDQLTEPLQLYQTTAKQAEQRTALLSKIPACLQDYEGLLNSSNCWLREAQSWLVAPRTYTTAKCIHCHANSLKMMLDESEGYRAALEAFLPALQEITLVCDTSPQQQLLQLCIQNITLIQQSVLEPLSHLQHLAAEMDAIEAEVKTMEKNITKIRTILSATDTENIFPEEHLKNIQVILDNVQSMKRTIDEIESCRPGLGLPAGAEQTLTAFHRAQELLQPIQELQQLSVERNTALMASIGQPAEMILPSDQTTEFTMPHLYTGDVRQVSMEAPYTEEEDEDNQSSSSGTLTSSIPEDPDETIEEEDIKTGAASAVTECVTKESSPEEVVDFPAIKHVIQDTDTGSCLLEPSGFSEMPGIDSRPVTEETISLPALTSQHLKEFTNDSCLKPDSANIAKEKQNECTETKLTEAVPAKPGICSEITMLKARDASELIEESESVDQNEVTVNTETGTRDQVKTTAAKPPDTEAVNVTDGDQTQTDTKPIDAAAPLLLSSQLIECVPQEDTTLEIQRDLIEAIIHESSSQSQEHTFQHTATVSDLSQSEGGGEDQESLVQLLTSLKETSETLGSCQDISSFETRQHLSEIPVSALNASESQMGDSNKLLKDLSSIKSLQSDTWTLALERRRLVGQNNVDLQRCSEALLNGLRGLQELGFERLLRGQDAQPQNCSQLHSLLTEHKKYYQDLGQNLVMEKLQYPKLPEGALQAQAEVAHLISALQDQAQTHGVRMQHSLEEWSRYEEVTERLCKQLDEMETNMSSLDSEPEGDLQGQLQSYEELEGELNRSETWTQLTELFSDLKDKLNPYASELLSDRLEKERTRHQAVTEDVHADLLKAQNALRLWLEYERLTGECCVQLNQHWERLGELMSSSDREENTVELLNSRMQGTSALEKDMPALQSSVGKILEASKLLIGQMKPQSAPLIKSETRLLSRDHAYLGKALSDIGAQVQEELEEHCSFSTELKSMEQQLKNFESIMTSSATSMDRLKMVLLDLSGLNPNLAALNQTSFRLSLSSTEEERLQSLNAQWVQVFSQASDRHRKMYGELLHAQNFQQKCQCWMEFQDKIKAGLSNQTSGNCAAVKEQLAAHQKLKVEVLLSQQLDAIISEGLRFLESSQNEDRSHLILRVTQLKAQWQGTQQRVQQHGRCLEGLMGQWQLYEAGSGKLSKLLRHIEELLPLAGLAPCSLQQIQCSIKDFEWTEEQLQLHEELYRQTVEAGGHILLLTDAQTQTCLQTELDALKEMWERSCGLVRKRKALADTITHEDEDSLQIWAGGLKELTTMKADVSQYVLPADTALLQGQVEELHSQWEELCLKVSLRKQEIADRLNAWIIFNDKNKELCDWLTQMEKKVAHRGENLSIEEMVEKLKKDCMEEINLFSENKSHLKQLGEQLLLASDKAKEAEIHGALRDVNDRWQHLFDHIEARVKKLTETLVTVQQLDKNMNNLRSWLTRIEAELAKPIHYSICHRDEIQKRLAEQQDLQRDIEQHTERVASVLTLCDVLLHDEDACSSDGENDSIQQTTQRLDQRWRNICSTSLERRLRIEETWRLWCKFQEDYSSFEDWLNVAERSAAEPNSSDIVYTDAKEELQKYEVFQRQVHESLTQLEIINNQYRRLARENRADAASRLRAMVHQGNQRWDALQRRVAAILRRLRHFTCQREEFEGTRESLLVWLTEIDLQLTNVENFSESHLQDKMKQLKSFKKEITMNTNKIDALIVFGEGLIQRSCPQDAVVIEDELEELHTYCQEVFGRVARFHQRLTSLRPLDVIDGEQSRGTLATPSSSQPSMCLLSPPQEHSGRETPVNVDSIPLEWDHTGDVGGSSSHDEEEDAAAFSALSGQNWHFQNTPEGKSFQLDSSSPTHTSTPFKQDYVQLMSECSGSIKSVKKVSMILDDEEQQEEQGLTGLNTADKQSGVIERWELLQAQAVSKEQCSTRDPQQLTSDLHDITSWLDHVTPELDRLQKPETSVSVEILEERVKQLKEMQKTFARYKTMMLSLNLGGRELQQGATGGAPELQEGLRSMNHRWTEACAGLEGWENSLRTTLGRCQEFHEMVHSQLLWLAHAESRRYTVNLNDPSVQPSMLQEHRNTLKDLAEELQGRQKQVNSLQAIVSELLPEAGGEDSAEAREKLHVIGSKLRLLSCQVDQDHQTIQERLESMTDASGDRKSTQCSRPKRDPSPQRSFFYRVLRAAFPLHLLFLLLLVLACLVPLSEDDYSCTFSNNFARSFHPMLHYTNGPPPT
ncbi:nesprin-2-like [Sinocyclocheilus rhinocerous]|uniref:nesprin-2-like n=1 Tax=Sinocyclocheilus rhinocerous TaxID=307959 RepID=UPI0007B7B980|nr:PREDICTED: nesprin-2-like [Sinocyclocheilus rhinocerous]